MLDLFWRLEVSHFADERQLNFALGKNDMQTLKIRSGS